MTQDEQDKYLEGFLKGIFWPDQWEADGKPGGPFASDEKTRQERSCWLEGWEHGHRLKLAGYDPEDLIEDPFHHMRK